MARRALIILIALALAVAGTWIILTWVNSATERELADVELVEVLVATELIAAGTPAEQLGEASALTEIMARSQVPGAVVDLADVAGLVVDVDILQGEQLTTQRFVDPADRIQDLIPEVEIPDGWLEVSFSFSEDQFVGGQPQPGELVAYIATFDPFTISPSAIEPGAVEGVDDLFSLIQASEEEGTEGDELTLADFQTPNTTAIMFRKVLIANIQYGAPPALVDEEGNPVDADPRELPNTSIIVTFAAPAGDIERMVFTNEFGRVWLAREPADAPEGDTEFITRGNVFP